MKIWKEILDPDPHQLEKWDPDPHQNVLDPSHWFKCLRMGIRIRNKEQDSEPGTGTVPVIENKTTYKNIFYCI